jgi:hypothetical protein
MAAPLYKLHTFALLPGQTVVGHCTFCNDRLTLVKGEESGVLKLIACNRPGCVKAQEKIDAA